MDSYVMDIMGSSSSGVVKRIRTPHVHDVLSGRGGGINSHDGNRTFREWVRQRKNKYNLAGSKAEKAQVAKEVITLVKSLKPAGRFLQRENATVPGGAGWWVELDETKAMAKTSQALREGAPQIRAAHKDEFDELLSKKNKSGRKRKQETSMPPKVVVRKTVKSPVPLTSTVNKADEHSTQHVLTPIKPNKAGSTNLRLQKRRRVEISSSTPKVTTTTTTPSVEIDFHASTPPLVPLATPEKDVPALEESTTFDLSAKKSSAPAGIKRSNSLALSDISNGDWEFNNNYEFVNPFEYDSEDCDGGYEQTEPHEKPQNIKQRERSFTSQASGSLKSFSSALSDLPDLVDRRAYQDTEFNEGMKMVYDAAHPGLASPTTADDTIPTHLYPYKGGSRLSTAPLFSLVGM